MKYLLTKIAIAGAATLLVGGFAMANVGNDHTGYDSDNNATIESENEAKVAIHSMVGLDNDVDGTMKTGDNKSSYNTGSGHVDTGDADAHITATNKANENMVSVSAGAMGTDMTSVTNSTTGADSENNAWIKNENELDVRVDNHACVDNDVALMAKTGGNASSYNTGNGSVSTGGASLTVSLSNTLNSSEVTVH